MRHSFITGGGAQAKKNENVAARPTISRPHNELRQIVEDALVEYLKESRLILNDIKKQGRDNNVPPGPANAQLLLQECSTILLSPSGNGRKALAFRRRL